MVSTERKGGSTRVTHLEDLKKIEKPLLQVIFKGKDKKVTIRQVGMCKKRLIGKVPRAGRQDREAFLVSSLLT